MYEAASKILSYTEGMDFNSFQDDERTVDAVIRNFEIIGEGANRLDDEYRNSHPEIHWGQIRGFRNRIIHEYFGIDREIVWQIIEDDINPLLESLDMMMKLLD